MEFQNQPIGKRLKKVFGKSRRKARENFKGEDSKRFDLTLFRKETIKIVFDSLHGISNEKARGVIINQRVYLAKHLHIYRYLGIIN